MLEVRSTDTGKGHPPIPQIPVASATAHWQLQTGNWTLAAKPRLAPANWDYNQRLAPKSPFDSCSLIGLQTLAPKAQPI